MTAMSELKFNSSEYDDREVVATYAENLSALLYRNFYGVPLTIEMQYQIKSVVEQYRTDFLAQHRGFKSYGDVVITSKSGGLSVTAEIKTVEELREIEKLARRDRETAIATAKVAVESARATQSRYASMLRRRRKLYRRYKQKLPYGVSTIWNTLTKAQQYAILKDIAYEDRHATTAKDSGQVQTAAAVIHKVFDSLIQRVKKH